MNLLPDAGADPVVVAADVAVPERDPEMQIPPRSSIAKVSPVEQLEEQLEEERLAE
jgi:hypothetical protein